MASYKRGGLVTLRISQQLQTACLSMRNNWFTKSGSQPGAAVYKVAVRQCHFLKSILASWGDAKY